MVLYAYLILLGLWLLPVLLTWQIWSGASLNLRRQWQDDYGQMFCGRSAAMQENLKGGLALWIEAMPDFQLDLQQGQEAAVRQWLQREGEAGLDCASRQSFSLYRQDNPRLDQAYPNWWVRWHARLP